MVECYRSFATVIQVIYYDLYALIWWFEILCRKVTTYRLTLPVSLCTGAGKTHTVLGYKGEPGMYELAAAELLEACSKVDDSLALQVKFVEVCIYSKIVLSL